MRRRMPESLDELTSHRRRALGALSSMEGRVLLFQRCYCTRHPKVFYATCTTTSHGPSLDPLGIELSFKVV
jgi:hypothetical protein